MPSDTAIPPVVPKTMPERVQALTRLCREVWWECDLHAPPPERVYAPQEQQAHEIRLARFIDELVTVLKHPPRAPAEQQALQTRFIGQAGNLLKSILGSTDQQLAALQMPVFAEVATTFAQTAHRFDPTLSGADIYQAGRNVMTGNLLQLLLNRPIQLTPALFAYSLLYPYTDNYLDDDTIPLATKAAFNRRFARRLAGERLSPSDPYEQTIFTLVGMIETQYDRAHYAQVFDSLLAIHRAQGRSLQLTGASVSPYELDVLGVTFEKGGTSVLADGYLVAGVLTEAQAAFMFELGAFLQLADDLEDVEADRQAGQLTVFSQTAAHWPLDKMINRTLHLGVKVLSRVEGFDAPHLKDLGAFMRHSAALPLIQAAGQVGRLCSKPYLRELEKRAPCRFAFWRQQRRKLAGQSLSLTGIIGSLAQANETSAPPFSTFLESRLAPGCPS